MDGGDAAALSIERREARARDGPLGDREAPYRSSLACRILSFSRLERLIVTKMAFLGS